MFREKLFPFTPPVSDLAVKCA